MSILSQPFVFDSLEQERNGVQFPINFDDVWAALGYSLRENAIRALKNKMEENIDWVVSVNKDRNTVGRPSNDYSLSVNSFKMFCLMAETSEGREVRQYFIDLEKEYVKTLERQFAQPDNKVTELYTELGRLHCENAQLKSDLQAQESARTDVIGTMQVKVFLPRKDVWVPLITANDTIGYANITYAITVLKEEFIENVDWRKDGLGDYEITEACLHELVIVARPQRGAKVTALPEILIVERDRMFRVEEDNINRRFGHRR